MNNNECECENDIMDNDFKKSVKYPKHHLHCNNIPQQCRSRPRNDKLTATDLDHPDKAGGNYSRRTILCLNLSIVMSLCK